MIEKVGVPNLNFTFTAVKIFVLIGPLVGALGAGLLYPLLLVFIYAVGFLPALWSAVLYASLFSKLNQIVCKSPRLTWIFSGGGRFLAGVILGALCAYTAAAFLNCQFGPQQETFACLNPISQQIARLGLLPGAICGGLSAIFWIADGIAERR